MPTLEFVCDLNAPIEAVWAFHNTAETLIKLTPPNIQIWLEGEASMEAGSIQHLRMRRMGLPLRWDARIAEANPPTRFVDEQLPGKGPFKAWRHEHCFRALSDRRTRLTDRITYEVPFGPLGAIVNALFIRRDLETMFRFRHQKTREWLEKPNGKADV